MSGIITTLWSSLPSILLNSILPIVFGGILSAIGYTLKNHIGGLYARRKVLNQISRLHTDYNKFFDVLIGGREWVIRSFLFLGYAAIIIISELLSINFIVNQYPYITFLEIGIGSAVITFLFSALYINKIYNKKQQSPDYRVSRFFWHVAYYPYLLTAIALAIFFLNLQLNDIVSSSLNGLVYALLFVLPSFAVLVLLAPSKILDEAELENKIFNLVTDGLVLHDKEIIYSKKPYLYFQTANADYHGLLIDIGDFPVLSKSSEILGAENKEIALEWKDIKYVSSSLPELFESTKK